MPIPELNASYQVRAKVRIGEKKKAQSGNEYPVAIDYFVSDDPEIEGRPDRLFIVLPYPEVDDCFSTGLEWWMRSRAGNRSLACFTHDDGPDPVALRMESYLQGDEQVVGEKRGQNRLPIRCLFRNCPQFKDGGCRPMGRLEFFIWGGRDDAVLRLDTQSWNSITAMIPPLLAARRLGPLNALDRFFVLSVEMKTKGSHKFPVLTLQEAHPDRAEKTERPSDRLPDAGTPLEQLVAALNRTRPGWRRNPEWGARIRAAVRENRVEAALKAVLEQEKK